VDDEATQSLVDGFVGGINFGELVTDYTVDMATEATDEEESSSEESSSREFTGSEDESDESQHGSIINRRPMQVSPRLLSPSQYNNTNVKFHHRSTPQVPRTSPIPACPQPIVLRKKHSLCRNQNQTCRFHGTMTVPRSHVQRPFFPLVPSLKKVAEKTRFTFDRLLTLEMCFGCQLYCSRYS
jgi:hypothetical protein